MTTHTDLAFGDAIYELAKLLGTSQRQLAVRVGISSSYLSDLRRGVKRPSVELIERIATATGTPPTYFREYREHLAAQAAILALDRVELNTLLAAIRSLK